MNDKMSVDSSSSQKSVGGDKKVTFDESAKRFSISEVAETVEDPFCDENNPRVITFQDVCQAVICLM